MAKSGLGEFLLEEHPIVERGVRRPKVLEGAGGRVPRSSRVPCREGRQDYPTMLAFVRGDVASDPHCTADIGALLMDYDETNG